MVTTLCEKSLLKIEKEIVREVARGDKHYITWEKPQKTKSVYAVTRSFMHRVKSSNRKSSIFLLFDDFTLCMKLRVTA